MEIINIENCQYREKVNDHIKKEWGLPIVSKGNIIDIHNLPGFIAVDNDELIGAVLYQIKNDECEIAVIFSLKQNVGAGSGLINAVIKTAQEQMCKRVWLITTNDNTPAIRFYQKRGFNLKAVHENAFKVTQKIKGEGDDVILGIDDIPILHEVEFEILFNA